MAKHVVIETQRLLLRHWRDSDVEAFISMNADSDVMRYFPATLSEGETRALYGSIQRDFSEHGYGLYAAGEKDSGRFIGFIGLHRAMFDMDFCPCIEIGWRLDKRYWNKGYATEGAKACLKYGFESLGFDEIVSFTAVENKPSQRVMQKIGLMLDGYFDHPGVPENHPLRPHVLYRTDRNRYRNI